MLHNETSSHKSFTPKHSLKKHSLIDLSPQKIPSRNILLQIFCPKKCPQETSSLTSFASKHYLKKHHLIDIPPPKKCPQKHLLICTAQRIASKKSSQRYLAPKHPRLKESLLQQFILEEMSPTSQTISHKKKFSPLSPNCLDSSILPNIQDQSTMPGLLGLKAHTQFVLKYCKLKITKPH